jgi:ubiquinone/menaquinone biosynthesis C-methylase UbiE
MDLQLLAAQLRKPDGEIGKQIGEVMNNGNNLINQWTIAALDVQDGDSILEIGMGNGYFVKDILSGRSSVIYHGVDYSQLMVDEAKKLNASFIDTKQANFTVANAGKMPFESNYFNKIFTINTIYFWDNAEDELREIKRVLQPGGKFVIAIRTKESMDQMPFTEYGFIKYNQDEFVDVLQKNGFTISNVDQRKEPPYDFNGKQMELENLIVSCTI